MQFRGITGLRTYTVPLQRDLSELVRHVTDINGRLGLLTQGESIATTTAAARKPGRGLVSHAYTHELLGTDPIASVNTNFAIGGTPGATDALYVTDKSGNPFANVTIDADSSDSVFQLKRAGTLRWKIMNDGSSGGPAGDTTNVFTIGTAGGNTGSVFYLFSTGVAYHRDENNADLPVYGAFRMPRGTSLPATPSDHPAEYFILDRQGSSLGDIIYMSLQKSDASWAWYELVRAR